MACVPSGRTSGSRVAGRHKQRLQLPMAAGWRLASARQPRAFRSSLLAGKMVCTGTKSEQEARTASRKYAKILQKLGYAVSFKVGRGGGGW